MVATVVEELAYRDRKLVFKDRLHAGELLADKIRPSLAGRDVQLLAVPAGGVPVGYVVAQRLKIPVDVAVVR
jgi:predicted phosphoribosyltransferase